MSIICFHYITNGRLFVPDAKLYLPTGYSAFISREIQRSRAQFPAPCLELAKVINFALSIRKFAQDAAVFVIELFESALVYCGSDFTHHFIIEIEVMKHAEPHSEPLIRFEQVADIGARITPARRTAAVLVYRE